MFHFCWEGSCVVSEHSLSGFPRGWFVVCFSDEIGVGQTLPLRYFGQHLAAWRGQDGGVRVLEAHCAHMGAHLGVGGKVVGNDIACPFHAWRYCDDGRCIEIPYAKKIPPKAVLKSWPVRELNGLVLIHHDPDGKPPTFEIPVIPEYGTDQWLPWTRKLYKIRTHPREIVDNLADRAHFPAVHRTTIEEFDFGVDGHLAWQKVKGTAHLEDGTVDNFSSMTTYHGPGYLLMRMNGALQNYMLVAHTPVDGENLELRMGVMLKIVGDRQRTEGYVAHFLDNLRRGFEDDFRIWENKIYRDPPLLCDGDGPIGRLRKWYRQFYSLSAE
jgi:phenylpropionate dioxygenase-like ring-hydroxylating dioxygenase large terminal subunit